MIFVEAPLPGAWIIELESLTDERGSFARTFDRDEFRSRGLETRIAQCNVSFNHRTGTLRGMHFQRDPHGECKLIRCTRGRVFDVLIDLRRDSPTYCAWFGVALTPDNGKLIYAPNGLAHGFLTLEDKTEVSYQMSSRHVPDSSVGIRWDDPAFAVKWPEKVRVISERDRTYPDFRL